MFRIKDPKASLKFYTEILGMELVKKADGGDFVSTKSLVLQSHDVDSIQAKIALQPRSRYRIALLYSISPLCPLPPNTTTT
jgi:catechol 2,3-dioxygenase-like lactoylglutathione lyase family enzyme